MFRIGEFSKLTQVSIRMLRYYDEEGLLLPEYVDPMTGYRMYSIEQIKVLQHILFLREIGFGTADMKKMLTALHDEELFTKMLKSKQADIENNIEKEKQKLLRIESALIDLKKQSIDTNLSVTMKQIPSYQVISIRDVVDNYYCEEELWMKFSSEVSETQQKQLFAQPSFTIYLEQEQVNGIDMECCVILPEKQTLQIKSQVLTVRETKAINAACFYVYGDFAHINEAYHQFAMWLEQHPNYKMSGESRQIVHKGPPECNDPNEYIIELQVELIHL